MKVVKVLGAIVSGFVVSVGSIGLRAEDAKAQINSAEVNYLSAVQDALMAEGYDTLAASYDYFDLVDSSVEVGYTLCRALNGGVSVTDLIAVHRNADWTKYPSLVRRYGIPALQYEASAQITAAIHYLCPQHVAMLETWISQNTATNTQSATHYAPYTPRIEDGMFGTLTAADPDSQINIRSTPSLSASSPHYGVVGDRVWVSRTERRDGYDWYFVGYLNNDASGWVRGDFVDLDWR